MDGKIIESGLQLKTYNGILNFLNGVMITLVGDRLS